MCDVLNEDVLLEIFTYLNLEDLLIVDQVCSQFNHIANRLYKKYKNYEILIRFERNLSGQILRRIGKHLDTLLFSCGYLIVPTTILSYIAEHCIHLRKLTLLYITMTDGDLDILKPVLSKLDELTLSGCRIVSVSPLPTPVVLLGPAITKLSLHYVDVPSLDHFLSEVIKNNNILIHKSP